MDQSREAHLTARPLHSPEGAMRQAAVPAAQVAGGLLRRLAIPAPDGVRPLRAVADAIAASLPGRQARLGRPVPEGWLATAGGLAHELGASAGDRLVHADLHYATSWPARAG